MSELEKKQETPPPDVGTTDTNRRPDTAEPAHHERSRSGFSPDLPMTSPD
jgi:hypothetical protein